MDDGVKSNFGTHKELIVLKIVQYKYYVNKSRTFIPNVES